MQFEFAAQIGFDLYPPRVLLVLFLRQQDEIIAIAQVVTAFKSVFDELIQSIEIHIGKELAVKVTDRQALVVGSAEQGLVRWDFVD